VLLLLLLLGPPRPEGAITRETPPEDYPSDSWTCRGFADENPCAVVECECTTDPGCLAMGYFVGRFGGERDQHGETPVARWRWCVGRGVG
jgi:hypothetical protein